MKAILVSAFLLCPVFAQPSLDCAGARYCEMREQTVSSTGRFSVEGVHNGSLTVRGSNRPDVLVRMRVETDATSSGEAKDILGRIHTHVTPGRFTVDGPGGDFIRWFFSAGWSVSVEVLVPNKTDLRLATHNGAIQASGIDGRIQLDSHNGAIRVADVTGDVRYNSHNGEVDLIRVGGSVDGTSHNGQIEIELTGTGAPARHVRVESHNGAVTLALPASYSARVTADTHNGGVRSDFASPRRRGDDDHQEFDLGSGTGSIKVSTHNGGIRLRKLS